jgi:hypothetical protein
VVVPGCLQTQLALARGGFPQPVWFKNHPQAANVRSMGGLLDRQIMEGVRTTKRMFEEQIRPLPKTEQEKKLAEMTAAVQAGTPPRQNLRNQRTIGVVVGRGRPTTHHALSLARVAIVRPVSSRLFRPIISFTLHRAKRALLLRRKPSGTARSCSCSRSRAWRRFGWFADRQG